MGVFLTSCPPEEWPLRVLLRVLSKRVAYAGAPVFRAMGHVCAGLASRCPTEECH